MALTDVHIQVYDQLGEFFKRITEGQAPNRFTRQYLKDLGFASSNFNAVIPLLKALGFLAADGAPTEKYHAYRNGSQSRRVMGEALREAYGDLFMIKANPTDADRGLVEGKFKSAHNTTDRVAKLMTSTFYSLLGLADLQPPPKTDPTEPPSPSPRVPILDEVRTSPPAPLSPTLHYNIQIHLPDTKDVEVFNAIFRSLKEHLLG